MITVLICTKNNEKYIRIILEKFKDFPVVLVDCSTDRTRKIAKSYDNVKIVIDDGNGLAKARNLGLKHIRTKYVLMSGADNIIDKSNIENAKKIMTDKKWVITGFKTLSNELNLGSRFINDYYKKKIKTDIVNVVGTPFMAETKYIKSYGYNDSISDCDDTDLCARLLSDGLLIGYTNIISWNISENNFSDIFDRFKRYGISDRQFYDLNKNMWSFKRKIKSLFHGIDYIKGFPILSLVTILIRKFYFFKGK
jgi:glycosyltransferase involved in cell wall biosynthesis